MSYTDIAFLIIFIAIMIRGFFRGFIKEAISLLGVFFAYLGALFAVSSPVASKYAVKIFHNHNEEIRKIIIFSGVFLSIIIIFALFSFIVTKIINLLRLGFCNRLGGFFLPESKPLFSLA
jgi:membrane protein required for colicin V production